MKHLVQDDSSPPLSLPDETVNEKKDLSEVEFGCIISVNYGDEGWYSGTLNPHKNQTIASAREEGWFTVNYFFDNSLCDLNLHKHEFVIGVHELAIGQQPQPQPQPQRKGSKRKNLHGTGFVQHD